MWELSFIHGRCVALTSPEALRFRTMIRFYWSMCPQAVLCESYASFTAHVLHGPDMGHCAPKPSDMLIDWLRQFIFQRPITKWLLALYFLKLYLAVVCRCSSMRIEDRCCQYEATTLSERGSREAGLPTPGFHFRQQCPPCTGCQRTSGGLSFAAVTPNFVSSHVLLSSLHRLEWHKTGVFIGVWTGCSVQSSVL